MAVTELVEPKWSFRSPVYALIIGNGEASIIGETENFGTSKKKEHSEKSLKDSLLHLKDVSGGNTNEHLPNKTLNYGHNRHFVGWEYLGGDN